MPTVRIRDTAGQQAQPVVEPEPTETTAAKAVEELVQAPEPEPAASAPESGFSTEQAEALERLRRLGSRRAKLRAELEAVDRELLGEAILEAFKLGVPKLLIAKKSRVARQTVYNVIERVSERDVA